MPPIPPARKRDEDESSDASAQRSQYCAKNFLDCSYDTNLMADSFSVSKLKYTGGWPTGKIFITFNPLPTQKAFNPRPSA